MWWSLSGKRGVAYVACRSEACSAFVQLMLKTSKWIPGCKPRPISREFAFGNSKALPLGLWEVAVRHKVFQGIVLNVKPALRRIFKGGVTEPGILRPLLLARQPIHNTYLQLIANQSSSGTAKQTLHVFPETPIICRRIQENRTSSIPPCKGLPTTSSTLM